MAKPVDPTWSEAPQFAESTEAWETFFAAREAEGDLAAEDPQLTKVIAGHQEELLSRPNVVGVAPGFRSIRGTPTGERCIVIYVTKKIPSIELSSEAVLPQEIDGVRVDVVEIGDVRPLPEH